MCGGDQSVYQSTFFIDQIQWDGGASQDALPFCDDKIKSEAEERKKKRGEISRN